MVMYCMKDAKDKEGRSVEILGRSGIKYKDKENKYFIDSEMLVGPEFDLVIFSESVRYYKDVSLTNPLSDMQKNEIVKIVVGLLSSAGIRADVKP
jgi:hypothetical protein